MKAIAEIPLIGLAGTFAIIVGILLPPTVIKTTIDKETLFTYSFEKSQQTLLTLFRLSQLDRDAYGILGEKTLFESITCNADVDCPAGYICSASRTCSGPSTHLLKERIDEAAGIYYCITVDEIQPAEIPTGLGAGFPDIPPSDEILKKVCASNKVHFTTILVLPYNKDSLIKLIKAGAE